MTDQLRTLAEAEAKNEFHPDLQPFNLYDARRSGYVRGFIAGRTSVTREQILEVVAPFMHDEFVQGQECPADEECADAILALLNGESDD